LINEAHGNNFIFVLDRFPISFLLSKFGTGCLNLIGSSPEDYAKFGNIEAIKEAHNDVRNMALFLDSTNIPSVDLDVTDIDNPSVVVPTASGKIRFGEFTTSFTLDENFFLYRMFLYWMYAGFDFQQDSRYNERQYSRDFYVNGHLILLDNHRNKLMTWKLEQMHPKSITQIPLKYSSAEKIKFDVSWIYTVMIPEDDTAIFGKI
jgi:hypothetical protein